MSKPTGIEAQRALFKNRHSSPWCRMAQTLTIGCYKLASTQRLGEEDT